MIGGVRLIIKSNEVEKGKLPINKVILGDALETLEKFPENSVDAVVTDPPYGLKFMDKRWDYDVPSVKLWKEVLRVLKPGGHLLSFFGTRSYHRGVVNIEDAGFEIRDMILWLYGEGFPKGMDISKAIDKEFGKLDEREIIGFGKRSNVKGHVTNYSKWDRPREFAITAPATPEAKKWEGWNTSLKPACEPIVVARKPISEENIAQNVLKWGVGGLNIDACRVPIAGERVILHSKPAGTFHPGAMSKSLRDYRENRKGRFPANVILDKEVSKIVDKQSRVEASRFFYCVKASRDERFAYCYDCDEVIPQRDWERHRNHSIEFHPTIKPLKLIEYLVRLVTPPYGIVLDPFLGTGTTAIAAIKQGFRFIGIDICESYLKIALYRLKSYLAQQKLTVFERGVSYEN